MLFDLKLSNGFWNTINREARHINIVLAAGEIQARFVSKKGANYQTKMVSGMALELPKFDRVEIKSDTDQQIKVWVSDVPLSYSPDTARQVGSNALRSSVGYVYSGYPHKLLSAEIGRNRITLTPSQDIYLGGTNLNTRNGVLLPAGQPFTMATQGEVWALETTGNYPPFFTARTDPEKTLDKINRIGKGYDTPKILYYESDDGSRGWGWTFNHGRKSGWLYEYDTATLEPTGIKRALPNDTYDYSTYYQGSNILVIAAKRIVKHFDLEKGDYVHQQTIPSEAANITYYFSNSGYEYVYTVAGEIYRKAFGIDETWALYADPAPITTGSINYVYGCEILSTGKICLKTWDEYFTKEDGQPWVQVPLPRDTEFGAKGGFMLDKASDTLYMIESNEGIVSSMDGGITWRTEFDKNLIAGGRDFNTMTVNNGAVLAFHNDGHAYRDPITGEWASVKTKFDQRNGYKACISDSGRFYYAMGANSIQYSDHLELAIQGEPVPVGGLPVSIMAEVN